MNRIPHRRLFQLLIVLCPLIGLVAVADTPERVHLEVPAQSLSSALAQFGRESGMDLAFTPDTVRGKMSGALNGDYWRKQALKLLLAPAGLRFRTSDDCVIVIGPAPEAVPGTRLASAASAPLDTVTVEGRRQHEALVH